MKDAPAFPTTVRGKQEGRNMKPLQRLEGMTLRDYFAAKALPALLMFAGITSALLPKPLPLLEPHHGD